MQASTSAAVAAESARAGQKGMVVAYHRVSKMRRRAAANRLLWESQPGQKQQERLTANTKM